MEEELIAHVFRVNKSKLDNLDLMQLQLSLVCKRYCQGWEKVVITFGQNGESFLSNNYFIRISNK